MEFKVRPPASMEEALIDVSTRFLLNLPAHETPSVERLLFQIQQAHWYYEDFYVDDGVVAHLPSYVFAKKMFDICPLLAAYKARHDEFYRQFKDYIGKIPVYGGILLNKTLDRVLFIRPWMGKSWCFPKGKINEDESEADCAAREVYEETGYNPRHLIDESRHISWQNGLQYMKWFIIAGVPDDGSVDFTPQTRKEVSEIGWFDVAALPQTQTNRQWRKFWSVFPVLQQLFEYLRALKGFGGGGGGGGGTAGISKALPAAGAGMAVVGGGGGATGGSGVGAAAGGAAALPGAPGTGKKAKKKAAAAAAAAAAAGGGKPPARAPAAGSGPSSSAASSGALASDDDLMGALEAGIGGHTASGVGTGSGKWSVADMFATNERLLNKRFTYDGNPHNFGDYARYGAKATPGGAPLVPPAAAGGAGVIGAGAAAIAPAAVVATGKPAAPGAPPVVATGKPDPATRKRPGAPHVVAGAAVPTADAAKKRPGVPYVATGAAATAPEDAAAAAAAGGAALTHSAFAAIIAAAAAAGAAAPTHAAPASSAAVPSRVAAEPFVFDKARIFAAMGLPVPAAGTA